MFMGGATQRLGKVQDGTSVLDHEPEEIKHYVSISTAFHTLAEETSIPIDRYAGLRRFPGGFDQLYARFRRCCVVLNPPSVLGSSPNDCGIRPMITGSAGFLASKMDHEQDNVVERIDSMLEGLEVKGVHLQMPIGVEANFKAMVDLLSMKAYLFEGDSGKFAEGEVPGDLKGAAEEMRQTEKACRNRRRASGKILGRKELSTEELKKAIREQTRQGKLYPVLYGSALKQIGIPQLLDAIIDYLPSPLDEGEMEGTNPITGEAEKRASQPTAPFSAYVFKTIIDPFAGKLSVMRVASGKIASDGVCYVPNKQVKEKIGHMFRLEGKKQDIVKEASAGDIVAAAKLKDVSTGDTLCDEKSPIQYEGPVHFRRLFLLLSNRKARRTKRRCPRIAQNHGRRPDDRGPSR